MIIKRLKRSNTIKTEGIMGTVCDYTGVEKQEVITFEDELDIIKEEIWFVILQLIVIASFTGGAYYVLAAIS